MSKEGTVTIRLDRRTKRKLEKFQANLNLKYGEKLNNDEAVDRALEIAAKELELDIEPENGIDTPSPDES